MKRIRDRRHNGVPRVGASSRHRHHQHISDEPTDLTLAALIYRLFRECPLLRRLLPMVTLVLVIAVPIVTVGEVVARTPGLSSIVAPASEPAPDLSQRGSNGAGNDAADAQGRSPAHTNTRCPHTRQRGGKRPSVRRSPSHRRSRRASEFTSAGTS
jgi:hypothetical protein